MLKFLHQVASCYITTLCFWISMPLIPISCAYIWKWVTPMPWHALFSWLEEGDTGGCAVIPAMGQDHTQTVQRDLFIFEVSTRRDTVTSLSNASSISWGKLSSLCICSLVWYTVLWALENTSLCIKAPLWYNRKLRCMSTHEKTMRKHVFSSFLWSVQLSNGDNSLLDLQ